MITSLKKKKPKRNKRSNSSSGAGSSHPLLPQVKALVSPFECTPGSGKHLVDPMPSQAYKLKARATISVANGQTMVGMISPCFGDAGNSAHYPSGFFISSSGSQLGFTYLEDGTSAGSSAIKGTGTYAGLSPVRPYDIFIQGGSWRLVSYGLRIRYTGTALNANGTLKYLPNDLSALRLDDATSPQDVIDYVNGNNHTIMRSIYDRAVYDFTGLGSTEWMHGPEIYPAVHDEGAEWGSTATQSAARNHWVPLKFGQNSSPVFFGMPGMLFTYNNTTTATIQFEIELVENWEVRSGSNTAFQTDSHGNPELSQEVFRTVVSGHMHAASSSVPSVTKSLQTVNAASKSPLGKLVIAAALA